MCLIEHHRCWCEQVDCYSCYDYIRRVECAVEGVCPVRAGEAEPIERRVGHHEANAFCTTCPLCKHKEYCESCQNIEPMNIKEVAKCADLEAFLREAEFTRVDYDDGEVKVLIGPVGVFRVYWIVQIV